MKNKSEFGSLLQVLASENLPHLQGMGRRERRAAETRLRLFRCALQLFAQRGFPNVTVEDITEAADVGKGTFFNYFESKDDVLGVMAETVKQTFDVASSGRSIRSFENPSFPLESVNIAINTSPNIAFRWPEIHFFKRYHLWPTELSH